MEFSYLILGLVQGVGEVFPISSSAHLRLLEGLLLPNQTPEALHAIHVLLHAGSLVALLVHFRSSVLRWFRDSLRYLRNPHRPPANGAREFFWILLASMPTAILGLWIAKTGLNHPSIGWLAVFMAVNGLGLISFGRCSGGSRPMFWLPALLLGLIQGVLTVPGFSRSGWMFLMGLGMGLPRTVALRFAFLMGLPGIVGALILAVLELVQKYPFGFMESIMLILASGVAFAGTRYALVWIEKVFEPLMLQRSGVWCMFVAGTVLVVGLKG